MRVSVFGLGYVGTVSAACLCRDGHTVVGVDPAPNKVALINEGKSPIVETNLEHLLADAVGSESLRATSDHQEAVCDTDMSLVCVGTPSLINGNLDLKFVRSVCEQIGQVLAQKKSWHIIVIRSTMLPGSMDTVVIPTLEIASGRRMGVDFGVCINPEFLREGTAVEDYDNPPKTVVGSSDAKSAKSVMRLYQHLPGPKFETNLPTAEVVKYTDNSWHALKVAFANEIGNIANRAGVDSHQAMEIFCSDTKLNISKAYLKPGFAFGGSCLPKDLRALTYRAKSWDIDTPVLSSILPSNRLQIQVGLDMIRRSDKRRIGILGFSFKEGTDDLRESPMVELIEQLIGKGYELSLYDNNVNLASLSGANRDFILNQIPHISRLMRPSIGEVLEEAELVVIGTRDEDFVAPLLHSDSNLAIVDFVRLSPALEERVKYSGICWGRPS